MMSAVPPTERVSGVPSGKPSVVEDNAKKAFAEGKYEESATLYAQLLESTAKTVGEDEQLHESLGPLYLAYGKSLLQLAIGRQTMGLVSPTAIAQGFVQDAESPEDDRVLEFSSDVEGEEDMDDAEEERENDQEEEDASNAEETVDDFGVAFEMLDLARLVFEKSGDLVQEAEARQEIGDLYMESEEFPEAIDEYKQALQALKAAKASFREQASLQFKVGIALEFTEGGAADALDAFQTAKDLLEKHLEEEVISEAERNEVESLVGELQAKCEELSTGTPSVSLKQFLKDAAESANKAIAAQAQDISSLVKKRRPALDEEGVSAKKEKLDDQ